MLIRILILFLLASTLACSPSYFLENVECAQIRNIEPLLTPGKVVMIGEIPGTLEGPYYVQQLACHALKAGLSVTIGLELPQSDQSVINQYLRSNGTAIDRSRVLDLPFWAQDDQDGRTSQAMFALLEVARSFRVIGQNLDIILMDDPRSSDRDAAMAANFLLEINKDPSRFYISLTSKGHNIITNKTGRMGHRLIQALGDGRVVSLRQNFQQGTAWIAAADKGSGIIKLSGDGRPQVGIFIDAESMDYHGTFEVGTISASRPAKELIKE